MSFHAKHCSAPDSGSGIVDAFDQASALFEISEYFDGRFGVCGVADSIGVTICSPGKTASRSESLVSPCQSRVDDIFAIPADRDESEA